MADVVDLGAERLEDLDVSEPVRDAIRQVQIELAESYRDSFMAMVKAMNDQASALNRIQETLNILVKAVKPELEGQLPPAVRVAGPDEQVDIATAFVVADPIGAGFTMSQTALAQALGVPQSDVSILSRAFRLHDDERCALVVRRGRQRDVINYHPRAVARFRELVASPPKGLSKSAGAALKRVRKRMLTNV